MAAASQNAPAISLAGLSLVLVLHVAAFALLLRHHVLPPAPPSAPLAVDLLSAPPSDIPPTPVTPRRREATRPVVPAVPASTLARPVESPEDATSAAVPASSSTPSTSAPATAAPPAPPPMVQARFDADYLNNPKPAYPPMARRLGEQGRVVLRVLVTPQGRVADIERQASSGSPRLDQAAQDTVRQWRFVPARRGEEAISAWVLVPIAFTLKE